MQEHTTPPAGPAIIVEFPVKQGSQQVSRLSAEELARKSSEAIDQTMVIIQEIGQRITNAVSAITDPPKNIEVEFGIKFDAEAGAVLAKASMECSINVKLSWGNSE